MTERVSELEHAAGEARNSEQKAIEVAKMQAKKTLAERSIKESLLAKTKGELTKMKQDISRVKKEATAELKREVQEARETAKQEAGHMPSAAWRHRKDQDVTC